MKSEFTLSEDEIAKIIADRFGITENLILYFEGGMINPQKMRVVYYTSEKRKNTK